MKTNYFFLLFFLLILMGCSDDKNIPDIPASTEDTYEGCLLYTSPSPRDA